MTRRTFLSDVAIVATAPVMAHPWTGGLAGAGRQRMPTFAFVGTYSSGGNAGGGRGIHVFEVDPATGGLRERDPVVTTASPSALAFHPDRTVLYAANEVSNFQGGPTGSVSAYAVDRATGRLTFVNAVSSEGGGATHLSVHPSGRHVFVANYGGGSVAVLPVGAGGALGRATDVKRHEGVVGPTRATNAPPGSFAVSGHNAPHAHMIQADPAGRFVLATDLGLDRIFIWRFDETGGLLVPADPPSVALPPGDGPRHFAFHPNGRWLYSIQEEASTIAVFDYDGTTGRLEAKQTVSSLPAGFAGTNFTSAIMVSPDARFVYAANRLHDSIAWFAIAGDGTLTFAGEEWTRGDYPRSFGFDPTGAFLYSCNQRADHLAVFRVDRPTGRLTFTDRYVPVGAPSSIVFLG